MTKLADEVRGVSRARDATPQALSVHCRPAPASGPAPGNYDDFRLTIGHGRGYTGLTIAVPTAAFPDS